MMPNHYRRLSATEISALPGATEYERLASFGAVRVGTSGGRAIVDVCSPDAPGLPGEYVSEDLASMHSATRANVEEAVYEDPDTGALVRCKAAEVPGGITPVETGLSPHEWA